jgi:hypothetical protein
MLREGYDPPISRYLKPERIKRSCKPYESGALTS